MTDIIKTIKSLPKLLSLKGAASVEITDAEIQLRISFSDEYKNYLLTFGAVMADGIELTGIAKAEYRNVVSVTQREWEYNKKVPHSMYVVEEIGDEGIVIWQDASGAVYKTSHDSHPKQVAGSLNEYIKKYMCLDNL